MFTETFDMSDNYINAFECIVLQSEELADQIIKKFKERWIGVGDPNELLFSIANEVVLDEGSLLPASKQRIENTISNYLEVFNV